MTRSHRKYPGNDIYWTPLDTPGSKVKYRRLADQVRDHIAAGRYKPGDKLPTEQELATLTKVHRVTVRSAYELLGAEGRTETRAGDGTYVIKRRRNPPLP